MGAGVLVEDSPQTMGGIASTGERSSARKVQPGVVSGGLPERVWDGVVEGRLGAHRESALHIWELR